MNLQDRIGQALHGADAAKVKSAREAADRESAREAFIASAVRQDALEDRSLKDHLAPFLRRDIQVNYKDPARGDAVLLAALHAETFTVVSPTGSRHHFPYGSVLSITEHEGGLTVEIFRQVFAKGAVGFGFSIPIGGDA